jgi:hypothetical protein
MIVNSVIPSFDHSCEGRCARHAPRHWRQRWGEALQKLLVPPPARIALARRGVHCGDSAPVRPLRPPGALRHRACLRRVVRMAMQTAKSAPAGLPCSWTLVSITHAQAREPRAVLMQPAHARNRALAGVQQKEHAEAPALQGFAHRSPPLAPVLPTVEPAGIHRDECDPGDFCHSQPVRALEALEFAERTPLPPPRVFITDALGAGLLTLQLLPPNIVVEVHRYFEPPSLVIGCAFSRGTFCRFDAVVCAQRITKAWTNRHLHDGL